MSESKEKLRREAGSLRAAMDGQQVARLSKSICARLASLEVFGSCRGVFIYVSFANEVSTHDLIRSLLDQGRVVTVPKMVGRDRMVPVRVRSWQELVPSHRGVLAPVAEVSYEGPLEVCVVPGVAFSADGARLGYGGGCYDRYLADHPKLLTIGLAYELQMIAAIPVEPHDRRVDAVVTELRTVWVDGGEEKARRHQGT